MPMGDFYKRDVREIAKKNGLKVADKPDSQEVCFIPDGNYSKFLIRRGLNKKRGKIVDSLGNLLGYHNGYFHFTVGQREGLGVAAGKLLYVTKIDALSNTIVVGDNDETLCSEFFIENPNWFIPVKKGDVINCAVKIRYGNPDAHCSCHILDDRRVRVVLEHPQRAVTPGQAAVFYHGDMLIGGGWIE